MSLNREDRPTAAEHYARAQSATDLTPGNGRCATNVLMSAAWSGDSLGILLLRLRNEFDGARRVPGGLAAPALIPLLASLRRTRKALAAFALRQGRRQAHDNPLSPRQAMHISMQVLRAWLDPNCAFCEGRGFNGQLGAPMVLCTACRGTGRHRAALGGTQAEQSFGEDLLSDLERKVSHVERRMAVWQRGS